MTSWQPSEKVRASVMLILRALFGFLDEHGLVVGALATWVIGAAILLPVAGLFAGGAALMFLELRRRK